MAKILVVDDSKLIRMQLKGMLETLNHEVVAVAEDGQVAYELYKETQPDLVTMDINMPVLDGVGSVKKIIAEFPQAKIVMISSIDDKTLTYDCIAEGALDFILKPVKIEKLEEKINSLL